jgi:hypothetical protein
MMLTAGITRVATGGKLFLILKVLKNNWHSVFYFKLLNSERAAASLRKTAGFPAPFYPNHQDYYNSIN